MSRSVWKEVGRAQRRYSKAGESRLGWGMMRPRRFATFGRMEMGEATEEVARRNYRQWRRRTWLRRIAGVKMLALVLRVLLAPSWRMGEDIARFNRYVQNVADERFVVDSVWAYRDDEAEALRRVSMLRRELEAASLEVRHCRERRESMEILHARVVRAKLVQSLVDEPHQVQRPIWTMIDERKGMSA